MPDRITNTINTLSGGILLRPTVINCFEGELGSIDSWWSQWRQFMFETRVEVINEEDKGAQVVVQLLEPILQTKYPAITKEEQAISIPLQIMCLAIFDAILVHMLNTVASETWQRLRTSLCMALYTHKDAQISRILDETYTDAKVVFVQEAAAAFVDRVLAHPSLSQRYMVLHPPQLDGKRDQNSIILADKAWFDEDTATDITPEILAGVTEWPTCVLRPPPPRFFLLAPAPRQIDAAPTLVALHLAEAMRCDCCFADCSCKPTRRCVGPHFIIDISE